ncbi:MAG: hypothetical protein ACRC6M_18065 [Microcystaceae cyanobacterium]
MLDVKTIAKELSLLTQTEWELFDQCLNYCGSLAHVKLKDSKAYITIVENEKTKKITVYGGFRVKESHGEVTIQGKTTSINFSASKTAAQMARQINQRLIKTYLSEFENALTAHNQREARRVNQLDTLSKLAISAKIDPPKTPHSDRIYGYDKVREILISGMVHLKLSVSEQEALAILKLIA